MAPPAAAAATGHQAPPPRRRLLSIGVQAAALAVFLLFAAAATILLVHVVVTARVFRRYRVPTASTTSPPPPPPPLHGLSPADLRLLPCLVASPRDDPSSSSSSTWLCPVCLEVARAGERWRALPSCGHAFHAACVDRWLARSPSCPVCRAAVAFSVS